MNKYAEKLKNNLLSPISTMELMELERFIRDPEADFKRHRKLGFSSVIQFILSVGSASLGQELLKYFQFAPDFPSASVIE